MTYSFYIVYSWQTLCIIKIVALIFSKTLLLDQLILNVMPDVNCVKFNEARVNGVYLHKVKF